MFTRFCTMVMIITLLVGGKLVYDGMELKQEAQKLVNDSINRPLNALFSAATTGELNYNSDAEFRNSMQEVVLFGVHMEKYEVEIGSGVTIIVLGLGLFFFGGTRKEYSTFYSKSGRFFL